MAIIYLGQGFAEVAHCLHGTCWGGSVGGWRVHFQDSTHTPDGAGCQLGVQAEVGNEESPFFILGFPVAWWLISKTKSLKRTGYKPVAFHGKPQNSHSITSAVITSQPRLKGRVRIYHLSTAGILKPHIKKSMGLWEILWLAFLENATRHTIYVHPFIHSFIHY